MSLKNDEKINTGTRYVSMILDHLFMTIIAFVLFVPQMFSLFIESFHPGHAQPEADLLNDGFAYLGIAGFAIYFCKDSINGQSIAKRILRLQVIDNATGKVAGPLRCFIRNITILVWPVEAIIALTDPGRRLGDRLAGTKLVAAGPKRERIRPDIMQRFIAFALAYGLMLLLMLPFKGIMSGTDKQKVAYTETSFNQQASADLEKLLADSLGRYLSPSVKIYDKVQGEASRYISVIMRSKENYLPDDSNYERIATVTAELIYSKYPKGSCTGRVKYIFHTSGSVHSRSAKIGTVRGPKP